MIVTTGQTREGSGGGKSGTGALLADFEHPFEMLKACHERIKAQCETLRRLAAHLPAHGSDAQAQQAASNVMRYFDGAGRHHHEDEEEDLFPRMIAAAHGQNVERLALLVSELQREHRDMEQMWDGIRDTLEKIAHGENAPLAEIEVNRFCTLYHTHIAIEEANMIPLAAMLLGENDLSQIGRAMAARRGVKL